MSGARQATVLAMVLGLVPLFIVVTGGGSPATVGLCALGLVMFGLGMIMGQAGMVIGGLAPLLFGAAIGVSENPSTLTVIVAMAVLGVVGPWCLITADVSWWMRRDADVELRVFTLLVRSTVPASLVGVTVAVGALVTSERLDRPDWLVPAAVLGAAAATLIVGETIRRRRPDRVAPLAHMTAGTLPGEH